MKKYLLVILFLIQTITAHADSLVCLHGFFRSYRCMIPLANVMREEGMNVFLWDYPSRKKTIEEHAECLVEVLNAIAQRYPNEPIHFATHSLGGVIVRAAVSHPNCPKEARMGRAILLAPPNQGAVMARKFQGCPMVSWIFGKKAGKQLMTYTETEMGGLGDFPEEMHVMVVAGKKGGFLLGNWAKAHNDGKVTVEETRLNSPHYHHILNVSHSWIMTSRESINLTKQFLTSEKLPLQGQTLATPKKKTGESNKSSS